MSTEIAKNLGLGIDHIKYIISGYAAYEGSDAILDRFRVAFPEDCGKWSEQFGEVESNQMLEDEIIVLSRSHPKFDEDKYGALFNILRRCYLESYEESFLGQRRNRLKVADDILDRLNKRIEEDPDSEMECIKLQMDVLKVSRAESDELKRIAGAVTQESSAEQVLQNIPNLSEKQMDEFIEAIDRGEDQGIIIQRILREAEDKANGDGQQGSGTDNNNEFEEIFEEFENQEGGGQQGGEVQDEHLPELHSEGNVDEQISEQGGSPMPEEG